LTILLDEANCFQQARLSQDSKPTLHRHVKAWSQDEFTSIIKSDDLSMSMQTPAQRQGEEEKVETVSV
jgi:hypothetical protein